MRPKAHVRINDVVELREVFRPLGAWKFDSPAISAGTQGTVTSIDDLTGSLIIQFPGHPPTAVPRSLLKTVSGNDAAAFPPPGLPPP